MRSRLLKRSILFVTILLIAVPASASLYLGAWGAEQGSGTFFTVPEPSTLFMISTAFAGVAYFKKKRSVDNN